MAKKAGKAFSFSDVVSMTDGIIKKTSILRHDDKKYKTQRNSISTGIYVLNAAISADMYGGIPNNRISVFAGDSGVGKSFLCYNIARNAQEEGYKIIYIDTEFAIEKDQLPNYGLDVSDDNFMLLQCNVIEDLKIFMTQMLDGLKEQHFAGVEIPKMLIFIDSIGQLASRKEIDDAKKGAEKADMTRAKALGSFMRIINADLGMLNIGLVCTNHTYDSMDLYPKKVMKGGQGLFYSASVISFLSKAKLKDESMDDLDMGQSGILVTAKMTKNRLAKPKKVKFEISFVSGSNPYTGLDFWCTPENFEEVGICKGKMVGDTFVPGGIRWFVRHMGKHVATKNLFSKQVFTKEVLDGLAPILHEYFKYRNVNEQSDFDELEDQADSFDNDDVVNNLGTSLFGDDDDEDDDE